MVNENTQVLADGTKLSTKTSGSVYRDADGRTRREQTGQSGHKSVTIFDPVAATSVALNAESKTASKQAIHIPNHPATPPASGSNMMAHTRHAAGQNRVVEDLGTQAMEGVQVQGKRTTTTIPIGTLGNDREIKVVDEVWFSADLQVVVQSKHSDPRTGDVTYKLANIRRADQPRALFEVPADYQVRDGGFRHPGPPPGASQN